MKTFFTKKWKEQIFKYADSVLTQKHIFANSSYKIETKCFNVPWLISYYLEKRFDEPLFWKMIFQWWYCGLTLQT